MAYTKAEGIEGSPFQDSTRAETGGQGKHQANLDKQLQGAATQEIGSSASAQAMQKFDGLNADTHQKNLEKLQSNHFRALDENHKKE